MAGWIRRLNIDGGDFSNIVNTAMAASKAGKSAGGGGKVEAAMTRLAQGAAIATAASSTYHAVRRWHGNHFQWTLTLDEGDPLYKDVHAWLTDLIPGERQKTLRVWTGEAPKARRHRLAITGGSDSLPWDDEDFGPRAKPTVNVAFNDTRPRYISVDGHRVKVELDNHSDDPILSVPSQGASRAKTITLTMNSAAGQEAVLEVMRKLQAEKTVRKPALKIVNGWGNWQSRSDLPLRSLESVILPAGQKEAIVDDLAAFIESEGRYARLDLPYHRGYMLEGPAGTGKSSFVKAIANHFEMDLWYLPLADLKEESSLLDLLSSVSSRSIVLLEDIDTLQLTHDRDEGTAAENAPASAGPKRARGESGATSKLTLSGLLNVLDGVATPHGLITFMTTNHFDRLDSALTRAGRMDRVEHFGYPTADNITELYQRFYPGETLPGWAGGSRTVSVSMASLTEALKRNMDDAQGGAKDLLKLLENPVKAAPGA